MNALNISFDTIYFIPTHYIAIAILAMLSYGLGCRLTHGLVYHSVWEKIAVGTGLGLGVIASSVFGLGLVGLFYTPVVLTMAALAAIFCLPVWKEVWRAVVTFSKSPTKRLWLIGGAACIILFLPIIIFPLYPPFFLVDVTSYHLALAKILVQSHQVSITPYLRFPVFPRLIEMLFAAPLLLYDDILAQLTQFLMMILVAVVLYAWARRTATPQAGLLAIALWLATPLVIMLGASAEIDIGLSLFVTLGVYAVFNWMNSKKNSWLVLAGVFIGFAAGSKYSTLAIIGILGLYTIYWGIRYRNWKYPIFFGAICGGVAVPWYLFNWYYTGNPVFPFFPEIFGYGPWNPEDMKLVMGNLTFYGMGRTLPSFFLLPWNLAFNQEQFHLVEAPLLPFYTMALPVIALYGIKDTFIRYLAIVAIGYVIYWFISAQILRYLIPVVPLLSLATAVLVDAGLGRLQFLREPAIRIRLTALGAIFLVLIGSLYAAIKIYRNGPLPATRAQRDRFYADRWFSYDAYQLLNNTRGKDYTLYALDEEYMAYFADGTFMGDWVGPARFSRIANAVNGQTLYQELESLKATHLLVDKKMSAEGRHPTYRLPRDDFFYEHFEPKYARAYIQLYERVETPKRREVGPQLLQNPSFEEWADNQPVGWGHFGVPKADRAGGNSHTGSVAVQSPGALHAYTQGVPVKPGGLYWLGQYARATAPQQKLRLQIDWGDERGQLVSTDIEVVDASLEWKYYEMLVFAPPQATVALVVASPNGQSSIWFDDFSFVELKYISK